ncbi:MAG TPA: arginine deiminase-related protein [Candidatus Eisenbacteria bacterium]|nr:arginine deiminase-related protein [Candidatus Eisenbacteria bacterium]
MKVLMCRPDYFDVVYEINPWMDVQNRPDKKKSLKEWENVYKTYQKLGVEVQLIAPAVDQPDMVFTANGGIVAGKTFISGNYRYQERKGEEKHFQKWFKDNGYTVVTLHHSQGGEGDALFYRDTLYMGYGFRSDRAVHDELKELLQVKTVSLRLIDPYFYDFDTTFCPLGDRGVLYYPEAYDKKSKDIAKSIDGSIVMTKEQASNFVANSVYVDGKLLVGFLDEDLEKKLKKLDIEPILFNMEEFKKAGGGIKCVTLYLEK